MKKTFYLYFALLAAGPLAALGRAGAGFSFFRAQTLAACGFVLFGLVYIPVYLRLRRGAAAVQDQQQASSLARLLPAVFLCAGAEACFASGGPLLLGGMLDLSGYELWGPWALFLAPLLLGRLAAPLAARLGPGRALAGGAVIALAGLMCVFTGSAAAIMAGLALAGLGMANILPQLIPLTVAGVPGREEEVSALTSAALCGGALLPPLMGLVSGAFSPLFGFFLPLAALVYILAAAVAGAAGPEGAEEPEPEEQEEGPLP